MNPVKLGDLAKLLDSGAKYLENQNIHVLKMKGAKKIFFPMLVAAHNYTEGIYTLCKENRSHPCFSLLRSLCDNLINAKFLYCSPSKHCHVIFLDGLLEKKKQLNHVLAYLEQHPQCLCELKISKKDVAKSLKKVQGQERKVRLKIDQYPGKPILGTLERAKYIDEHNKNENPKSNSLEWIYILVFRTLSSSTHINFLDFPRYFKIEEKEIVVFLSGNPEETGKVLALADYLYKEILNMFLKIFKNPSLKVIRSNYV